MFLKKEGMKKERGWYTFLSHYETQMLLKDNMDQIVLSFMIFLLYPGYRKPGK